MKIDAEPGYRVHFVQRGAVLVVLLWAEADRQLSLVCYFHIPDYSDIRVNKPNAPIRGRRYMVLPTDPKPLRFENINRPLRLRTNVLKLEFRYQRSG